MKSGGEGPKIVQIETRYVETDAVNFRDVVQKLTGKNSSTAWIRRNSSSNAYKARDDFGGTKPPSSNSMLINNVSFKDFDGLVLLDLPPVEIIPWSSFS